MWSKHLTWRMYLKTGNHCWDSHPLQFTAVTRLKTCMTSWWSPLPIYCLKCLYWKLDWATNLSELGPFKCKNVQSICFVWLQVPGDGLTLILPLLQSLPSTALSQHFHFLSYNALSWLHCLHILYQECRQEGYLCWPWSTWCHKVRFYGTQSFINYFYLQWDFPRYQLQSLI